jgi:soluble lytic murein transglycosylase
MRCFGFCFWSRACGLLAALLPLGLAPEGAWAAVYRFVDDRGVIHFTNIPEDDRYQWIPTSPTAISERQRERRAFRAPGEQTYDDVIVRAARNNRIEPALVKAVIAAESNFERWAVSRAGAQGLMQLMPATAVRLGVRDPFHPSENVEGGTRYLRSMLDRYGDLKRALAAYNAGAKAVDRYRGIPPYPETQAYVVRVMNYYRGYDDEFRRRSRARTQRDRLISGGLVEAGLVEVEVERGLDGLRALDGGNGGGVRGGGSEGE